ncbi:MAG: tetratricopeptide repeat protein [Acidobacteriota bacterium]
MRLRSSLLLATVLVSALASAQPQNQSRGRAMPPYRLGLEELRSESWEKAAESFKRAIDIDPTFEMAYYALGRATMPQKKYAEAAAALGKCRDLYHDQAGKVFANQQEAQRYRRERLTEIDEVIRQYQGAPQTGQNAEALRQLGERRRLMQENLLHGTDVSLETSAPSFVSLALGSAFFRLGRMTDAEREYKATIAADPKTGEAHSNLAVVYLMTGRIDEAQKAVDQAKKVGFRINPQLEQDIREKKRGS